ncbi:hypothetical protein SOVF_004500 isoform A [Spinacia oleracea]|uniref:Methylenetetrahydrofolate reductase n=1 Tax=Spinacia oleracea TaxID=3562 RepID=A0ABM3RNN1_SPIOL|nr:methylenetetrahydrofolate reductase (NADH) 1-like isoform X2 [Spinacia oleracea]KNA25662.1 hypothetical protein SOVF_004500 isoform A [Spinacia oleracea]
MKVIDKIKAAEAENKSLFSFEYFAPKTENGVENLLETMERMVVQVHAPCFCDITWSTPTANVTMEIANRMQNSVCVEAMMHITCANMPVEKIDIALDTIKSNGLQNVLALRGDPPPGEDQFVPVEGGFSCALDLVKHMRSKYGDYFGIAVSGYPEAHPSVFGPDGVASPEAYASDLAYLKRKIPEEISDALERIKDNEDAVRAYGIRLGTKMCKKILGSGVKHLHLYTLNKEESSLRILMNLGLIEESTIPTPISQLTPQDAPVSIPTSARMDSEDVEVQKTLYL